MIPSKTSFQGFMDKEIVHEFVIVSLSLPQPLYFIVQMKTTKELDPVGQTLKMIQTASLA